MTAEMNTMQIVKRRFFAMRNGVIADVMRRAGSRFRIVFGLNLPQIADIAADYAGDRALAAQLWANRSTRESMLMAAIMLKDVDLTTDETDAMVADTLDLGDTELADVVSHRLLRRRPDAPQRITSLTTDGQPSIARYLAMRLLLGILDKYPCDEAKSLAATELQIGDPLTRPLATLILQSLDDE